MATDSKNISLCPKTQPQTHFAMTEQEVRKLGDALKDLEFRRLLCDYAREVTDDDNVARYEAEVTQVGTLPHLLRHTFVVELHFVVILHSK